MGDDDAHNKNLHGLLFKSASELASIKNKLIKIMTPNGNEAHSDEEDVVQEGDEEFDYYKEIV